MVLFIDGQGIKLKGPFFNDVLGMLSDDINHAAAGGVSKGDGKGEGKKDIDHFFAVNAIEEARHLFFLGGFFAGLTCIIRLFARDFHNPATK